MLKIRISNLDSKKYSELFENTGTEQLLSTCSFICQGTSTFSQAASCYH